LRAVEQELSIDRQRVAGVALQTRIRPFYKMN
jgi:hypothetical protein